MKRFLSSKLKLVNLVFFLISAFVAVGIYFSITEGYCFNRCEYDFKVGVINPVFVASKWLSGIFFVLLLFPAHIFKKWILFVAPFPLILTYILVVDTSLNPGGMMQPTRAEMAGIGMFFLTIVTVLFIAGHYLYRWYKNVK